MSVTAHFIVTREADKHALTDSFTDSGAWAPGDKGPWRSAAVLVLDRRLCCSQPAPHQADPPRKLLLCRAQDQAAGEVTPYG